MNVILTAGKAIRMGELAPAGCKALVEFKGRPMIEWQLVLLGEATIVCRSEHAARLAAYGPVIVDDSLSGPAGALATVLQRPATGPVTVLYADTFLTDLPDDEAFCGVADALGGRAWDQIIDGQVTYRWLPAGVSNLVCVGVYRFPDTWALALDLASTRDPQLGGTVNRLAVPFRRVQGWTDVGTRAALETAA